MNNNFNFSEYFEGESLRHQKVLNKIVRYETPPFDSLETSYFKLANGAYHVFEDKNICRTYFLRYSLLMELYCQMGSKKKYPSVRLPYPPLVAESFQIILLSILGDNRGITNQLLDAYLDLSKVTQEDKEIHLYKLCLSLIYLLKKDFEKSRYYINSFFDGKYNGPVLFELYAIVLKEIIFKEGVILEKIFDDILILEDEYNNGTGYYNIYFKTTGLLKLCQMHDLKLNIFSPNIAYDIIKESNQYILTDIDEVTKNIDLLVDSKKSILDKTMNWFKKDKK